MNSIASLPNNWQCHKQLYKIVWGVSYCPDCGGKLLFRPSYEWCKQCRKKSSVKSETFLCNSNLSYQKIWLLIWCWQTGQSMRVTKEIVGVSYMTIRRWLARFRMALPRDKTVLSGLVEADESFFGKKRFGKQRMVVGAIERDTRRVRFRIIPNRERETLENFIQVAIRVGSHIHTDTWSSYNELPLLGYTHDFCNHSRGHYGPTNMIENMWGVMKRHLRRLYNYRLGFTVDNLNLILNEWQIRQNQPEMMYNVTNYLRATACSGLVQ